MTALKTGMALAAGLGTRMAPLTDETPKPLIHVGGKTLLDHALERLAECGVRQAVVNVHYFADQMEEHLARTTAPMDIFTSDERKLLLETGGGLVKARDMLGEAPIAVTNTDAIFLADQDSPGWKEMFADFDPEAEDIRLLLVPKDRAMGLDGPGDFYLGGDKRLKWRDESGAPYFYTGMQVINPAVIDGWDEEPFSVAKMWNAALEKGRLTGSLFAGDWLHVGDPDALEAARERLGP